MRAFAKASAGSATIGNGWLGGLGLAALAALVVLCAALAPAAKAAEATPSYAYLQTIGNGGANPEKTIDGGVALDEDSGRIFLAGHSGGFVAIYAPDAETGEAPETFVQTDFRVQNLAVDSTTDAIYFDNTQVTFDLVKLVSDGQPTPSYVVDPGFAPDLSSFSDPAGVAVDPTTQDLLVADRGAAKVFRLDPSDGSIVDVIDGPDGGAFQTPNAVAVNSSGEIYVTDVGSGRVDRFAADGSWIDQLPLPAGSSPLSIAVNPLSGDVAMLDKREDRTVIDGFTATGTLQFSSVFAPDIEGFTGGLASDGASGRIFVNTGNGTARVFVPGTLPGVEAPVGTPGRNTMHVEAEVAPGTEPTTAWLEYCPATAACDDYPVFGAGGVKNPWKRGPAHEGLEEASPGENITIEDDLPLSSNASWKLRVTAENDLLVNTSVTSTVSSPLLVPGVETLGVGSLTETSAELTGRIDTLGDLTTYHFDYGTTTAYSSQAPVASEAAAGNNRQPRTVTQLITGLQPDTTYHYRLVATNGAGAAFGEDRTFTTGQSGTAAPSRAYEMVTPVDQNGALVNGSRDFWSAEDGSWFVTGSGATEPDGTSTTIWQHFLSRRAAAGWSDWSQIDPPRSQAAGTTEGSLAAVSEDGTHALVISNRVLDAGGIEGGGNLYVSDLENGTYEFVGAASDQDYPEGAYGGIAGIQQIGKVFIWGAPDFSSVVFRTVPPLLPEAPRSQIYRWSRNAGLELESTMPDGEPPSGETSPPPATVAVGKRQVSDDGSVSYFSIDFQTGPDYGVYRREDGVTKPISLIENGPPDMPMPGELLASSRDGRFALFSSLAPLTSDDPGTGIGLYRYDAADEDLTFLSAIGAGNVTFYGSSDDTQTAYFQEYIAPNTVLGVVAGDEVRKLSDTPPLTGGVISPSGRYFAWVEDGIRLYDAQTDSTSCVSCPAGGGPSLGDLLGGIETGRSPGNKVPRLLYDDGTLVFSTKNQLATEDQNSNFDVYTYKDGGVTLISPGNGPYDARVMETAADGRDIFFTTDQGLLPGDTNNVSDVYDARVGGGFAEPVQTSQCQREACKGPVASPPGTPALGSGDRGTDVAAASILSVRKLTKSDRAALARGGKAHLKVKVSGPGKVTVTGKASGSARAKKAGTVSVPISLSKSALSELRSNGKLTISLAIHFGNAKPKVVSMTLQTVTSKKGGSR